MLDWDWIKKAPSPLCFETIIKEGILMKQTNSFQRWKRRYFKLRGRTLYYAKTAKSIIFDEVDLTDASVAESSTKNVNNSFTLSGCSGFSLLPFTFAVCLAAHDQQIYVSQDNVVGSNLSRPTQKPRTVTVDAKSRYSPILCTNSSIAQAKPKSLSLFLDSRQLNLQDEPSSMATEGFISQKYCFSNMCDNIQKSAVILHPQQ
ncbi:hypothetical protein L345_04578, partial [Ophiophagus hannah]